MALLGNPVSVVEMLDEDVMVTISLDEVATELVAEPLINSAIGCPDEDDEMTSMELVGATEEAELETELLERALLVETRALEEATEELAELVVISGSCARGALDDGVTEALIDITAEALLETALLVEAMMELLVAIEELETLAAELLTTAATELDDEATTLADDTALVPTTAF
ncbi:hypothetical protein SLS60_011907 [Paraconiothyrium brasiliense]|uniref:Uncharacterized protein n=1 Tax=Paraconiothyrium brasiliense TaxID=300254 RepID=A0ABR3QH74_9PLEO